MYGFDFEGMNTCFEYVQKNMFFDTNEEISDERIYLRLRQMLPKYMVPSKIIRLKKLPTNVNGKLDRNKMKAMQNYQSFK